MQINLIRHIPNEKLKKVGNREKGEREGEKERGDGAAW